MALTFIKFIGKSTQLPPLFSPMFINNLVWSRVGLFELVLHRILLVTFKLVNRDARKGCLLA